MTYNEAYQIILTWITDNNNKEITAAIMRDVLKALLDFSDDNIGDVGDLFQEDNTVDAINELYSLINAINIDAPLQVFHGAANPNVIPPVSYSSPDIYVREDGALKEVYIFNGVSWVEIMEFRFRIYDDSVFTGGASSMNFVGGNWVVDFDPFTRQVSLRVTGEGVAHLYDIDDVPAYPNDGQAWKLIEESGVLTWVLDTGGAGTLAATLALGNQTGGENIVVNTGDVIDFSESVRDENLILFPNGGFLHHLGTGVLEIKSAGFTFRNLQGYSILSIGLNGILAIGDSDLDGSIIISDASSGMVFEISTPDITRNRFMTLPDGDIDWTAGASEDTYVMTWEFATKKWLAKVSSGGGGGGGVQSVTGTQVDITDPANPVVELPLGEMIAIDNSTFQKLIGDNSQDLWDEADALFDAAASGAFIPLSGTEVGSPVTGPIVFDGYVGNALLFPSPTDPNFVNALSNEDGQLMLQSYNSSTQYGKSFIIGDDKTTHFLLQGSDPLFRGLAGWQYYGANYDELTYVQKKYVDDAIADAGQVLTYSVNESEINVTLGRRNIVVITPDTKDEVGVLMSGTSQSGDILDVIIYGDLPELYIYDDNGLITASKLAVNNESIKFVFSEVEGWIRYLVAIPLPSGAFIPLSGTEVGSPVTGPVKIIGEDSKMSYSNSETNLKVVEIGYDDDGLAVKGFAEFHNKDGENLQYKLNVRADKIFRLKISDRKYLLINDLGITGGYVQPTNEVSKAGIVIGFNETIGEIGQRTVELPFENGTLAVDSDLQKTVPTDASNTTITRAVPNTVAILTPATTIATATVTFDPLAKDGDTVNIANGSPDKDITALTIVATGKTVRNPLTSLKVGEAAEFKYVDADSTWYRVTAKGSAGGGTIPTEEQIIGTATYTAAATGTVNLDLATFSDRYLILTGATTLTVSNLPASGKTFVKDLTIKSTVDEALTLPVDWIVIGAYAATGVENYLSIKFTNYPTVGAHVVCNIFQE